MKIYYLLSGSGSTLVMTSYPSLEDPGLIDKLTTKGLEKFLAYDIPIELAKQWYGNHFGIVAQDLRPNGDLRVLDYNGNRVFERLNFAEIGPPHVYDQRAGAGTDKGRDEIHLPIRSVLPPP